MVIENRKDKQQKKITKREVDISSGRAERTTWL